MFRLPIGMGALTAMVVALAASVPVNGQEKGIPVPPGIPAPVIDKGFLGGGPGGQPRMFDAEALFRKYAGGDGKLTLDGFKKLLNEVSKGQMGAPAGGKGAK
jgi:hypothetical protein